MMSSFIRTLVLVAGAQLVLGAAIGNQLRRDSSPKNPHDDNATAYCTWWHDYDTAVSCDSLLSENMITLEQFRRWNPSVSKDCSGLTVGRSYCVEAAFEPEIEPETTAAATKTSTSTKPAVPTSTKPSNGIETPAPVQPNIVDNCDDFYLVQQDDSCASIASKHGITLAQFLAWNRDVGSKCAGLWAEAYACVSIIGHKPEDSEPSPTKPSNGVETPQPIQPKIVDNCNKFHFVESGEGCVDITSKYGITIAEFVKWNPSAGSTCGGLWAQAYACVSVIGYTPTKPDNGIKTPTPTQSGMVDNCDKFHLVKPGEKCSTVADKNNISIPDFLKWNPKAGTGCTGLKVDAYACVSVIGHTPTKPDNGVTTPTPTQPDIVDNCNKFHFVKEGEKCSTVATKNNISIPNFLKWNPKAGSGCTGLKTNAYACVSVIGFTPTKPDNGVKTPTPAQPNMVDNCNKFHLVKSGQKCSTVANSNSISIPDFLEWNPEAGTGCTGLKTSAYACVWTINYKPTPVQGSIATNCKKYHFVAKGQTCEDVQKRYSVTLANLYKWNPAIGKDCRSMWAEVYLCVSV